MKTYCRGCRWLRLGMGDFMLFTHRCHHPENLEDNDTPMRARYVHRKIEWANYNNECKLFEKRWQ